MKIAERTSLLDPHPAAGGGRPEVVFALTGGGALGSVQVGMLRALLETGVRPDALIGASVGAINATFIACDPRPSQVERLAEVWRSLRRRDVFPMTIAAGIRSLTGRRHHLLSPAPLKAMLARHLPVADLAETEVPVHVATTDLDNGAESWWSSGPALEVLLASACVPGLFPPVLLEGRRHIDGAVIQAIPIARAAALGARRIYVLDVDHLGPPGPARSALDVALAALTAARRARLPHDIAALPPGCDVITLSPPDVGRMSPLDFSRADRLIEAGYRTALSTLATVRRTAA